MQKETTIPNTLQTYFEALSVLNPLLSAVELLGLLRGASTSGILAQARTPSTPRQIADALHRDERQIMDICNALDAVGVFVKQDGTYRLADQWAEITAPATLFSFDDKLEGAFARSEALRLATINGENFWTISSQQQLALAKGSTFDLASPNKAYNVVRSVIPDDLHQAFMDGGKYLELGCGVGGRLLNLLQIFPTMTAIGIELSADLAAEAQKRAEALGVSNRVQFRLGDARQVADADMYDAVFWSQTYFAQPHRAETLQVARRALKPGGYLTAPLLPEPSIMDEQLHTVAGQGFALTRVLLSTWGIPVTSAEAVQKEVEAAGFVDVQLIPTSFNRVISARRSL